MVMPRRERLFDRLCELVEVELPGRDVEEGPERRRHAEAVVLLDVLVGQLRPVDDQARIASAGSSAAR